MLQNTATLQKRYQQFIQTICANEQVFALRTCIHYENEQYAILPSNHEEDEDGEPVGVLCFWSSAARARDCCHEEWADYEVATFSLAEFLESWCVQLAGDGLLICAELDRNLFGWEAEPIDVLLDALGELKRIGKNIPLQSFDDIAHLERELRQILEDD